MAMLLPVALFLALCWWVAGSQEKGHGFRAHRQARRNALALREEALLSLLDMTEGTRDLYLRARRGEWERELLEIQDGD